MSFYTLLVIEDKSLKSLEIFFKWNFFECSFFWCFQSFFFIFVWIIGFEANVEDESFVHPVSSWSYSNMVSSFFCGSTGILTSE